MTFNMLAFITVCVYLSSDISEIRNVSRGPLVEWTRNDPTVNVYSSGLKQVNGALCWYCMLSRCSSEMDI